MAKKKIIEAPDMAVIQPEMENEVQGHIVEENPMADNKVKDAPLNEIDEVTVAVAELPDHVRRAFELYPEAEELYVDTKGGVFTKDTNLKLVGSAILYKNPYKNN